MVDNDSTQSAVVIDNGTGTIKAGLGGEDEPSCIFDSVIGFGLDSRDSYVGDEAQSRREVNSLRRPIQRGLVSNWDDMEKIWQHIFDRELCTSPEVQSVLLTETALNPKVNREKTIQIMLETFNTPAVALGSQSLLSLFASGRTTGMVVDMGEGVTHMVPVIEGSVITNAIEQFDVTGQDITEHLNKLLAEVDSKFRNTLVDRTIVQKAKESVCYVAFDYGDELVNSDSSRTCEKSYELPDGHTITIGSERFRAPECYFEPSMIGLDSDGIHKKLFDSIQKCNVDSRRDMSATMLLSGGSSTCAGMQNRLNKEMMQLLRELLIKRASSEDGCSNRNVPE